MDYAASREATLETAALGRLERTRAQVASDEIGQLALARLLDIVGEAAGTVSPECRAAHPELPWPEISST